MHAHRGTERDARDMGLLDADGPHEGGDLVGVDLGGVRSGGLVALARAGKIYRDATEVLGVARKLKRVARVVGAQIRDQQQRLSFSLHLVVDAKSVGGDLRHGRSLQAVTAGLRARRSVVKGNVVRLISNAVKVTDDSARRRTQHHREALLHRVKGRVACLAASPLRVLVVANRTAATPDLVAAVRRYAHQRPTTFALLIPDAPRAQHPDWTLELALSLLDRAAGGRVTGLPGTHRDPVAAIQNALATHPYDRIILSTRPTARRDGSDAICPGGSSRSASPSKSSQLSARSDRHHRAHP